MNIIKNLELQTNTVGQFVLQVLVTSLELRLYRYSRTCSCSV